MDVFATEYAIVEIDKLKEHEEVNREHSERLKNEILSEGVLKKSIAVDRNTNVVLDGHHRLRALKELGYTKIPAVPARSESREPEANDHWRIDPPLIFCGSIATPLYLADLL